MHASCSTARCPTRTRETPTILIAVAGLALMAGGCATRATIEPGKDCGFPACYVSVRVVDDGKGGKKLDVEDGGNIRMMTRHRLVALVWTLSADGYEFRYGSIRPHRHPAMPGKEPTPQGVWDSQLVGGGYSWNYYYATAMNTVDATMYYDITVYPSAGTGGPPISLDPVIVNDP